MRRYKPIDPGVPMTRADFVMELLTMWEESLQIISRYPSGTVQERGTKLELEAAIYVLKHSYPVSELVDVNSYDYLKVTVDAMTLLETRYQQHCRLIKECPSFSPAEVEKKLADMAQWRDEELSNLDRRKDADKLHG